MRSISFDIDERLERKIKKIQVLRKVNAEMLGAPPEEFDLEAMLRQVLNRVVDDILREEAEIDSDPETQLVARDPAPLPQIIQTFQPPPMAAQLSEDPVTQHKLSAEPAEKPPKKTKKSATPPNTTRQEEELQLTEQVPAHEPPTQDEDGVPTDFFAAVASNTEAIGAETEPDPEAYAIEVATAAAVKKTGRQALGRGMDEAFTLNQRVTPAVKNFNSKQPRVKVSHATTEN